MNTKKKIIFSLIFAVVIFVVTYLTRTPYETTFLSLGDTFVMLSACFLPSSWAMLSALLGCGIASFLIGNWQALVSITLFRVLAACWFMDDEPKLLTSRTLIGTVASFFLFSVGPALFNILKTEDIRSALPVLPGCVFAALFNILIFYIIAFVADKLKVKDKIK